MFRKGAVGSQFYGIILLLILILINGGAIAWGNGMFFGGEYDFREVEAEMLNYRIRNCILDNNVDDLLSGEGVGGFFEFCGLNKEVVEKWNIIKICENAEDCINSDGKLISGGENDFQQCGFKGSEKNLNLYRCSTSRIDKGEKQIEVIVGSKQRLRRGNE